MQQSLAVRGKNYVPRRVGGWWEGEEEVYLDVQKFKCELQNIGFGSRRIRECRLSIVKSSTRRGGSELKEEVTRSLLDPALKKTIEDVQGKRHTLHH